MIHDKQHSGWNEATGYFSSWTKERLSPAPSKRQALKSSELYKDYERYCNKNGGEDFIMSPELWGQWMIDNEDLPAFSYQGIRKRMAVVVGSGS